MNSPDPHPSGDLAATGATAGGAGAATDVSVSDKGLRPSALGMLDSLVIGVASTGPAYSIAATLGLVAAAVGFGAPAVVLLAFIPIFLAALGYRELNRAEPDCGTSFIWVSRAFGPSWGWMAGWAIVACDVLVMSSLAQVTGQYTFLLFGAEQIGGDANHPLVLLVGLVFLLAMTWLCVRGISVSAKLQTVLVAIETVMLIAFAVVALVRVVGSHLAGNPLPGSVLPQWSWFNPFAIGSVSALVTGTLLMVFIYWGWDSVLSVNEETSDRSITPGRAAVWATVLLLAVYVLVTVAALSFAGIGDSGIGLTNPEHADDVISALGVAVFGPGPVGSVLVHLLLLMVLTSAAASTQTTLLPTARTTFSMAFHGALPGIFGRVHSRWLTPTVSTWAMGLVSAALYAAMNFVSDGAMIYDAVEACGVAIGFYYGLTALACAWLYRADLTAGLRPAATRVLGPLLGGVLLLGAAGWTTVTSFAADSSETATTVAGLRIGNIFVLGVGGMLLGLPLMWWYRARHREFFTSNAPARTLPTGPVTDAVRD